MLGRLGYVDGEMLEEEIQERIKLLILSLGLVLEELRKNFFFVSRVSQPDTIEDFLSLDLDRHQLDLLNWIRRHTADNNNTILILDNLSILVDITDENSAGQMQNFNMMVTKARKKGCSMVIVHHTGKSLNIGLIVSQRGDEVTIWQLGWIRPFVFSPANHPWMAL